jgi:chromosome segregation ATPase
MVGTAAAVISLLLLLYMTFTVVPAVNKIAATNITEALKDLKAKLNATNAELKNLAYRLNETNSEIRSLKIEIKNTTSLTLEGVKLTLKQVLVLRKDVKALNTDVLKVNATLSARLARVEDAVNSGFATLNVLITNSTKAIRQDVFNSTRKLVGIITNETKALSELMLNETQKLGSKLSQINVTLTNITLQMKAGFANVTGAINATAYEIKMLSSNVTALKAEINDVYNKLEGAIEKNSMMLAELQKELEAYRNETTKLLNLTKQQTEEIRQMQEKINGTLANLRETLKAVEKKLQELKVLKNETEKQLVMVQKQVDQVKQLLKLEMENLNKTKEEIVKSVQESNAKLEARIRELYAKYDSLNGALTVLQALTALTLLLSIVSLYFLLTAG